jgi:hypothetical protein
MNVQQISTTIGGLCLIVMQVANIVSTTNVDRSVEQNHRELAQDTELITKEQQAQSQILAALKDLQRGQEEKSNTAIQQIIEGQKERYDVLIKKLDEIKAK